MSENHSLLEEVDPSICIDARLKLYTRMVDKIYRSFLKPFDITPSQLSILFFVGKKKSVAQSEIGKSLFLERSTVSRDLTRLIKRNLIIKQGQETRPNIEITDNAITLLNEVIPEWEKAHAKAKELLGHELVDSMSTLIEINSK